MTVRVDADQFGTGLAPVLPQESWTLCLAATAVIIRFVSLMTFLLLPSCIHFGRMG